MENALDIAREKFIDATDLGNNGLAKALGILTSKPIDQGDLYFQYIQSEAWSLEDGLVKEADFSIDQGVGARVISDEKTGFAYSNEIVLPALLSTSKAALGVVRQGSTDASACR